MGVDVAILHPVPNDSIGVEGRMRLMKARRQVESLLGAVGTPPRHDSGKS